MNTFMRDRRPAAREERHGRESRVRHLTDEHWEHALALFGIDMVDGEEGHTESHGAGVDGGART